MSKANVDYADSYYAAFEAALLEFKPKGMQLCSLSVQLIHLQHLQGVRNG